MAIKRKFPPRGATVYCSGGCRAKKDEDGGKIVQRGTHDELIQEGTASTPTSSAARRRPPAGSYKKEKERGEV